jgi:hypothetical protein
LASNLSYFLWNGPPDRRTLQLAAAGTLRSQIDEEVDRMIADPKFSRFANEFTSQWLSLDKFQVVEVDRKKYPKLTRDTRNELKQKPIEFVEYLIRNNLPVKNVISPTSSWRTRPWLRITTCPTKRKMALSLFRSNMSGRTNWVAF